MSNFPCASSVDPSLTESKGPKSVSHIVPDFGNVPSVKYCRIYLVVHREGADIEQCWNIFCRPKISSRMNKVRNIIYPRGVLREYDWVVESTRHLICAEIKRRVSIWIGTNLKRVNLRPEWCYGVWNGQFSLEFCWLGIIIHTGCVANKEDRVTSICLKRTFRL